MRVCHAFIYNHLYVGSERTLSLNIGKSGDEIKNVCREAYVLVHIMSWVYVFLSVCVCGFSFFFFSTINLRFQ